MVEHCFESIQKNSRPPKPREKGITEVRGPLYDPVGPRYVRDLFETMGHAIDIFKLIGQAAMVMDREPVEEMIRLSHDHDIKVQTGGFLEHVLARDNAHVEDAIIEAADLGFDVVEVSSGFLAIDGEDLVEITELIIEHGLEPKPEVGVQFGAGGTSSPEDLEREGISDPRIAIDLARAHMDAGAELINIESEGITEEVSEWRTDVIFEIAGELGFENCMFEAADPDVFEWYIKQFGPHVNVFVDHSQIVELECMRRGVWGKMTSWGRITTFDRTDDR